MLKTNLKTVPLKDVRLGNGLLGRKNELIRKEVLPYQWKALNNEIPGADQSSAMENFRIAAGEARGKFTGMVFQDSDLYKWLEAVAYTLATHPEKELEDLADSAIDLIEKAQQPDGYLNTYFTIAEPEKRWTNLAECHELYCAGHLIEAAVAYYQATGKRKLLDVAVRFADHIDDKFGPDPGKLRGYPGHQEIELALVKLYEVTGEERYLRLARYFLEERGREPHYFDLEWEKRGRTGFGPAQARNRIGEKSISRPTSPSSIRKPLSATPSGPYICTAQWRTWPGTPWPGPAMGVGLRPAGNSGRMSPKNRCTSPAVSVPMSTAKPLPLTMISQMIPLTPKPAPQ